MSEHQSTGAARVVRLAAWLLEVVRECPAKPWDVAMSTHSTRKAAERAAWRATDA